MIKALPVVVVNSATFEQASRYSCGASSAKLTSLTSERYRYIETDYALFIKTNMVLPFLPYRYFGEEISYSNGPYKNTNRLANIDNCFGGSKYEFASVSIADQAARKSFYGNLAKLDTFNASVALAELGETIGTVAATATRIAVAFKHLRAGRVKSAFQSLGIENTRRLTKRDIQIAGLSNRRKGWTAADHQGHLENILPKSKYKLKRFAANTWLEIQYGWTPLLLDIHGLAKFAAEHMYKSTFDVQAKGYGSADVDQIDTTDTNVTSLWNGTTHVAYNVRLRVRNPTLRAAASLGLTDPSVVAWELVPFSFVVDWFLPIGDYLNQSQSSYGYDVADGCKTVYKEVTFTGESKNPSYTCGRSGTAFDMSRSLTGLPEIASLSFNLGKALSVSHMTTALSLLVSAFHK